MVQEDAFLYHLDLARRAGLPVVIHTRDAAEQTLDVLADHARGLTVILHCFSLPDRLAEIVERGYYLSFAGNVTYKNAPTLQAAAAAAPAHLLLLETDAPWLTPVPFRGRPNRPALVAAVYDFVAHAARGRPRRNWPSRSRRTSCGPSPGSRRARRRRLPDGRPA